MKLRLVLVDLVLGSTGDLGFSLGGGLGMASAFGDNLDLAVFFLVLGLDFVLIGFDALGA